MVDELAVTNEIWRKWNDQKIILTVVPLMYSLPPMTWAELRKKVEEYVKAGKDPYDILREPPRRSKEGIEKKGFVEDYGKSAEEARVMLKADLSKALEDEQQAEAFYRKLSSVAYNLGLRSIGDKLLEIANEEHAHFNEIEALTTHHSNSDKLKDLFTGRTLEGYVEAAKVRTLETFRGVTFYFETTAERDKAREFLGRHNFYFPDGPEISLKDIDNPDYMLELLAYEGFDTSKIQVER